MVIQFKRGTAERWKELNLVLAAGEPGFVTDDGKNRFKVGDGVTPWNDLPYVGEDNVIDAQTHYDFPSIGKVNTIYKASSEKKIYQWNPTDKKYEVISTGSADNIDIEIIHGGNANL